MEIMYILDGHAEFELQNRKFISCGKFSEVFKKNEGQLPKDWRK